MLSIHSVSENAVVQMCPALQKAIESQFSATPLLRLSIAIPAACSERKSTRQINKRSSCPCGLRLVVANNAEKIISINHFELDSSNVQKLILSISYLLDGNNATLCRIERIGNVSSSKNIFMILDLRRLEEISSNCECL